MYKKEKISKLQIMGTKQPKSLGVFLLTMINIATILSIRNWPLTAEYGLSSVAFLLLAVIVFFLPTALITAELASTWPVKGGIFAWVKEALGHRMGLLAIWLLWAENIVWYPITLSFIAGTFAYTFNPSLANNPFYMCGMIISLFWIVTLINLGGIKLSGWISSIGALFGTLLPGGLIILLAIIWLGSGRPSDTPLNWNSLLPKLDHYTELAFLAGVLLNFCGIEMPSIHAKDVIKPGRTYPLAVFYSTLIIVLFTVLGTLSISIAVPKSEISLVSGGIEAIYSFFHSFGISWAIPIVAVSIALGALASVSTWTAGPCRGLLTAAQNGDFPPFMQKVNKHDMPRNLMLLQGVVVTILALIFVFMPSVSGSFWILTVLTSQLYLIMYLLLFLSGIILRYKRKEVERPYKIPGGNVGMWISALLGIGSSLFAISIGFIPPLQINTGNTLFFHLFLSLGLIICCSIPLLLYTFRRDSWKR